MQSTSTLFLFLFGLLWSQSFSFGNNETLNKQPLLLGHLGVLSSKKTLKIKSKYLWKAQKSDLGKTSYLLH